MHQNTPILMVENVFHRYLDVETLKDVSLGLRPGTISCLLGPSGSGKTTLLRCIAGLEPIENGFIKLGSHIIATPKDSLPPHKRGIGVVFQDYALFPHLNVEENIAFGLFNLPYKHRLSRVDELLDLVKLKPFRHAYPTALSGGQQQRVAIARALAPSPKLLLFDEPFSNLDPALRDQLKSELKSLLKHAGVTALIVTHNQDEAFDMADEIGVMADGRLLQWGPGYDLYHRPRSKTVAAFLGIGAFLPAQINKNGCVLSELGELACHESFLKNPLIRSQEARAVTILLRPDDIVHDDQSEFKATLQNIAFRGMYVIYELRLPSGHHVFCFTSSHHEFHELGSQVGIRLDVKHAVILEDDQSTVIAPATLNEAVFPMVLQP